MTTKKIAAELPAADEVAVGPAPDSEGHPTEPVMGAATTAVATVPSGVTGSGGDAIAAVSAPDADTTAPARKRAAKTAAKKPGVKKPRKAAAKKAKSPATKKAKTTTRARAPRKPGRAPFELAGHRVTPGKRMRMELPIGNLMSGTPVALPLIVVHGKKDGPVVWISGAIHGDEICGVEIIRHVLEAISATTMAGTVIAAPIVNVHGFNTNDRYLPDRRDLNRSFPGSARGSLASRIAHLFMNEVVKRSDVGIDLHSGSDLRTNLPQIRCDLDHAPTLELAQVFGAPIVIDARLRDGSLRQAALEAGKVMLLFEGGEASRFDPPAISAGTAGVLRTLNHLGLTEIETSPAQPCLYSRSTSWSRASRSGIVHLDARLGKRVVAKQQLATIYDPFGKVLSRVKSKYDGIVIGHTQAPLVNRGDALSHVARIMPDPPIPGSGTPPGTIDDEEA